MVSVYTVSKTPWSATMSALRVALTAKTSQAERAQLPFAPSYILEGYIRFHHVDVYTVIVSSSRWSCPLMVGRWCRTCFVATTSSVVRTCLRCYYAIAELVTMSIPSSSITVSPHCADMLLCEDNLRLPFDLDVRFGLERRCSPLRIVVRACGAHFSARNKAILPMLLVP